MNISFITIQTKDIQASVKFYTEILGFKVAKQYSPAPGIELAFLSDEKGSTVEFVFNEKVEPFSGHGVSIGFHVDDVYAVEKDLKAKGIAIERGPIVMKNGVILMYIKDNNGFELGFVQEAKA